MPNQRVRMVFKNIMENRGKSVSSAMLDEGFSPAYASNPQQLTRSKGWKELMDQYIPEEELNKHHKQLLNLVKLNHYVFPESETNAIIREIIDSIPGAVFINISIAGNWKRAYFLFPDANAKKAALDMGYKLRGRYKKEKDNVDETPTKSVSEMEKEIRELRKLYRLSKNN